MNFDVLVIGSGPGGYVAAIRASQLGFKVGVVERAEPGGICLNWGCIPTKSLLKSAQVFDYLNHAADYGISVEGVVKPDFQKIVERSRNVAAAMSKGIQYLFKKNNIEIIQGFGKLVAPETVEVLKDDGSAVKVCARHIILATGARSKEISGLKQDGVKIIGYREALTLKEKPNSMIVVGSGAIGSELAYFYQTIGTKVTLVEYLPNIVPLEDEEVSKQLARCFKKAGMNILTEAAVEKVEVSEGICKAFIAAKKGETVIEADIVLSAVGVTTNISGIGLEEIGVRTENGKVLIDDFYRTNISGVYAIGDIVKGPALAHVASSEGIICVESIAGLNPKPLDYSNIPSCVYTSPEVSSVGMTEKQALDAGFEIKLGKFPFTASGKASAAGAKDGFVKLIFDAKTGQLLGAHLIGYNVTEMISELTMAINQKLTGHDIIKLVHPHPTMSEAVMEAAAAAYGEVIHL